MKPEFVSEEYELRIGRLRGLMEREDLDGIMVTADWSTATNYRYLSGHLPRDYQRSHSRPHVFVMNRNGDAGVVSIYFGAQSVEATSWVKRIETYSQPFSAEPVLELMSSLGLLQGKVGAELGGDARLSMPLTEFSRLKEKAPNVRFVDASGILTELRSIKSEAEAEVVQQAALINHNALHAAFTSAVEGWSEADYHRKVSSGLVELHPDPTPPFGQIVSLSSPGFKENDYSPLASFAKPSHTPLSGGELVAIDSGTSVKGYWAEFARMGVVGAATADQIKAHERVRALIRTLIEEVIAPGVSTGSVVRGYIELAKSMGLDERHHGRLSAFPFGHVGHGIGLEASEYPLLGMRDDRTLESGMVLCVETAVIDGEMRYSTEEVIYLQPDENRYLSPPDAGLQVLLK